MKSYKDRHKYVPACYVICVKGSKILLHRRQNTGYIDGYYSTPSGHVEPEEQPTGCAVRELKEESGLTVEPEDLKMVVVVARIAVEEDHERVDFFFEAKKWQGEPKICEPHKCDDIRWFDLSDLPEKLDPVVKAVLEHRNNSPEPYLEIKGY